ncbi:gluconate 2-dehydrogenase (acceptor) [Caballeronia temeraria]|uniref:Gluconate 2-dehydrogenase (Acceptor) n=1 Tax=Caballeronia temeraria TaxID=1777137 RepID=A0A158DSY3_9BURK|nr:gluconate 2-dehydrogenase (acceptor) [Caballeronia temeraria]
MIVEYYFEDSSVKKIGITPGRRAFIRVVAGSAPAAVGGVAALVGGDLSVQADEESAKSYRPRYFNAAEWDTLTALVDRLIPADGTGPGALQAGVPQFIDMQMDQPWGHGHLWYMQGPFAPDADPLFGYQQPYAPRDLYRIALSGVDDATKRAHNDKLPKSLDAARRDALLRQMESNELDIGKVHSGVFFGLLLQNTYEGYFCDPVHGGNRNMAAWEMIGFPGARADYMDWVRQYGAKYPLPPVSRR